MTKKLLVKYVDVDLYQQEMLVLKDVQLEIYSGEFIYLLGKVGSGKSSLLKSFYGEVPIASGSAGVLNYDLRNLKYNEIPFLRRKIGIVFQDFQLLTDRTVHDNLEFVLKATGCKDNQAID
ncbi:MAG: ATP-binding cassette domain-containing protein, partial [Bacteroidales bacterium]|nr:ATP-binding cassette domain-containing protein [Bacteroidales bacterium]